MWTGFLRRSTDKSVCATQRQECLCHSLTRESVPLAVLEWRAVANEFRRRRVYKELRWLLKITRDLLNWGTLAGSAESRRELCAGKDCRTEWCIWQVRFP